MVKDVGILGRSAPLPIVAFARHRVFVLQVAFPHFFSGFRFSNPSVVVVNGDIPVADCFLEGVAGAI
jgi:hypothetical protein